MKKSLHQRRADLRKMLADTDEKYDYADNAKISCAITSEEYSLWLEEAQKLPIPTAVLDSITYIRERLQRVEVEGSELPRRIYVSDFRWRHVAMLLRVSAYVHGRKEAAVGEHIGQMGVPPHK